MVTFAPTKYFLIQMLLKMKVIKSLAIALTLCATMPAMAQFTDGGNSASSDNGNFSRIYLGYNVDIMEGASLHGVGAGYAYNFRLSESMPMYLDFGGRLTFNAGDPEFKFLAVAVPVNVNYRVNVSDNIALQPYTGLAFRVNAMADMNGISLFDYANSPVKRFQMGWQIGTFADFGKFGAHFEYGYKFLGEGYSTIQVGVSYKL